MITLENDEAKESAQLKALTAEQLGALHHETKWILRKLEHMVVGHLPKVAQQEFADLLEQAGCILDNLNLERARRALVNLQASMPDEASTLTE